MKGLKSTSELPKIPDKRYFPIREAAELCDVQCHVLRYWESEFSMLKPTKRRGSHRAYTADDIQLVREIRELLYLKGFTINGARNYLKANRGKSPELDSSPPTDKASQFVKELRIELELLLEKLR